MGRAERRSNGRIRERDLPSEAVAELLRLQDAQQRATTEYQLAGANIVRGMGLGPPKEGHLWVVDPQKRKVREQPAPPR